MKSLSRNKLSELEKTLKSYGDATAILLEALGCRVEEIKQKLTVAELEHVQHLQGEFKACDKMIRSLTRQSLEDQNTEQ